MALDRRQFLQVVAATSAYAGAGAGLSRAAARQSITQDDLLAFEPVGQVTLLNFTDCHAQLAPLYFREPSINIGVGGARGLPPHISGLPFLAAALAMKPFMTLMSRFRRHLRKVEIVIGLLLVATGVLFITEQFSVIAYWLLETFPIFNTVG